MLYSAPAESSPRSVTGPAPLHGPKSKDPDCWECTTIIKEYDPIIKEFIHSRRHVRPGAAPQRLTLAPGEPPSRPVGAPRRHRVGVRPKRSPHAPNTAGTAAATNTIDSTAHVGSCTYRSATTMGEHVCPVAKHTRDAPVIRPIAGPRAHPR